VSLEKHNYIHVQNGRLTGDTSPQDIDGILEALEKANAPSGLAIHFHGGVVSKLAGMRIAERLDNEYRAAGAYPLFFVWESGIIETLRNNLGEISQEKVFERLLARGLDFVLRHFGLTEGPRLRGEGPDAKDKLKREEVQQRVTSWFERKGDDRAAPPFEDLAPPAAQVRDIDVDTIQRKIEPEIMADIELRTSLEAIREGRLAESQGAKADPQRAKTRGATRASAKTLMTPEALETVFGPADRVAATRGVRSWLSNLAAKTALFVYRVVQRRRNGRDHGVYTTLVEEILRAFYLANAGKLVWDQMKKDTADAFGGDAELHGGTAFLSRLASRLDQGLRLPRVTLIGHSTGAVYICNFLKAADPVLPKDIAFDVVFLAPAVTCKTFAQTLSTCGHRICNLRTFAMADELERGDALFWKLYPRSLLYFVSGVLEDEADEPLVGMQRFFNAAAPFTPADHPEVIQVRDYLSAGKGRSIWSIANDGDGLRSDAKAHVAFDDEEQTIASLRWILEKGL
jgi:hypothetical protein